MTMGGDVHPSNYDEFNDIQRRGSHKRRRVLGYRLAEDVNNAELEWPAAQHAPNFFTVTSSTPSRMKQSEGVVPLYDAPVPAASMYSLWTGDTQPTSSSIPSYAEQTGLNQPYFYNDPSAYTPSWPPSTSQTSYDIPVTGYQAQTLQQPFENGTQYLNPLGGSDALYDTSTLQSTIDTGQGVVFVTDPAYQRARVLDDLDGLATTIIQIAAHHTYAQFQTFLQDESGIRSEYRQVRRLFEEARGSIVETGVIIETFISQDWSPVQQDIARKVNTATFIISILEAQVSVLFQLNRAFLDIFVPLGHRVLKWQGAVYLELKTQTYILALLNDEATVEELLEEVFPHDLDGQILQRHSDAPSLSPSEQDFVDRCRARRQYLLAESYTNDMRNDLPKKYQWVEFVREFSSLINRNVDHILHLPHKQTHSNSRRRALSGSNAQDTSVHLPNNDIHETQIHRSSSNGHHNDKKPPASGQTTRQAWTKPEEEALMAGLERVGGPHWSQILALYGRGGAVNEVLKDRNQVQLKDKARNLKLWYLKMGQDVPKPLRGVTGELRKRGGARARAALEAEEQQEHEGRRLSDDVDEYDMDPVLDLRQDTADPLAYDTQRRR